MKRVFIFLIGLLALSLPAFAQVKTPSSLTQSIKSTPAYAELLLRKTELNSEIESLAESYTEDFPKMKEARFELSLIQKDLNDLLKQTDASKLTLALGKMMVKRASLNTDLWALRSKLNPEHPDVKRAQRRVSSFDEAIKEIMP